MHLSNCTIPASRPAFGHHLDRALHDACETSGRATHRKPAVDIWEDGKAYFVDVDLAGFSEENVTVTVQDGELRLEATREETPRENAKALYRERHTGPVTRVLRFPTELEQDEVEARFERGVLHVMLPKVKAALPRRIEIKG
ncbi:Hsp20/alpha crystallin family protein [bacterium]|nr:Hsp20/alpha crystallin family protein [bacterium]